MDKRTFITKFTKELENAPSEELSVNTSFRDLDDWDSMTAMMIIAMIDENYNVVVTPEEMKSANTIEDLINLISAKQQN